MRSSWYWFLMPLLGASLEMAPVRGQVVVDRPAQASMSKVLLPEAEVRFADGSVVRVQLLEGHLPVQTRYGKLTIPVQEIRRIDFGLHLSEAASQRIAAAIKLLGSDGYRQREQAVQQLAREGLAALPALLQAAKSTDLEVARRAEQAAEQIRAKLPAEAQHLRSEDLIETTQFPISGQILSPTLKVRSPYFGEVELRLSELRQLRLKGAPGDCEITIDASRFGSSPNQWLDTGYDFLGQGRLRITARGQVDLWPQTPGQYLAGPRGYTGSGTTGGHLPGALLGRIGESGAVFPIGECYNGRPRQRGRLYLHIVPSPWNNVSSGGYQVQISTSFLEED